MRDKGLDNTINPLYSRLITILHVDDDEQSRKVVAHLTNLSHLADHDHTIVRPDGRHPTRRDATNKVGLRGRGRDSLQQQARLVTEFADLRISLIDGGKSLAQLR